MSDQSQWEDLQRSWQSPPDHKLPELASLLKKRTWAIWVLTAVDAVCTLGVVGVAIWVLANDRSEIENGLAMAALVLLVLGWGCVLDIRRGTWGLETAAPSAMLDLSIRRCRASITLALLNQYAVFAGVLAGLLSRFYFQGLSLSLDLEPGSKLLIRVGAALLFILWLLGAEWYKRRKRVELKRLEALRAQLD
jgi:hypothetical protein